MAPDDNPAFVILEMLQSDGWKLEDIDMESMMNAAQYFDEKDRDDPNDARTTNA